MAVHAWHAKYAESCRTGPRINVVPGLLEHGHSVPHVVAGFGCCCRWRSDQRVLRVDRGPTAFDKLVRLHGRRDEATSMGMRCMCRSFRRAGDVHWRRQVRHSLFLVQNATHTHDTRSQVSSLHPNVRYDTAIHTACVGTQGRPCRP